MRHQQHRPAGGLVDAARLHPDEAVLHKIEPPDAVAAADLVQPGQQRRGRQRLAVDRHRIAALEADLEVFRRVRRVLGRHRALVDVGRRLLGGVLQNLALRGGVQEVRVDRERRLATLVLGDRDLVLLGEFEKPGAAGQVPFPPGRDHPDLRVQRVGRQLEAHLVVALAGRAVRHRVGAGRRGDLDQPLRDQRPGDRSAEQVEAFVDRVRPEHRENEVAHESLAQVLDEDVIGTHPHHLGFPARRLELLALAEIGSEGHHLAAVLGLQPFQDDRGVEPAGIGEHDLLRCRHQALPRLGWSPAV